ncbi:MAG: glycosyltransferase family A protein [Pseudomonadota bacterium]
MVAVAVDVIMPARNAAATIGPAIASIRRQRFENWRLFIADDGSTDQTGAIALQAAGDDPRISLISHDNMGIPATLNRLLGLGNAPFVARADADDLSDPERFALQVARFSAEGEDLVCLAGWHDEIDAQGRGTGRRHCPSPIFSADPANAPAVEPPLIQPFAMMRRSTLDAVGGFRALPVSEDSDLYWRLMRHGRLAILDRVLGRYRMHAGSISGHSTRALRIMAVCSQAAALSAHRVGAGCADIDLAPLARHRLEAAGEVEAMIAGLTGLNGAETRWMAIATAAKLMELAGYRPAELAPADCRFIGVTLRCGLDDLTPANRRELARMTAATAARLLRLGRPRDAAALADPALWPQAMLRAATGRLYWTKHLGAEAA